MDILSERLEEISEYIWKALLGARAVPMCVIEAETGREAAVVIDGAWHGILLVRCSERLLERLCASMFQRFATGDPAEMEDTLRELANIVGGNLKTVLPESDDGAGLRLSLPRVISSAAERSELTSGDSQQFVASFGVDGEPFEIEVCRKASDEYDQGAEDPAEWSLL